MKTQVEMGNVMETKESLLIQNAAEIAALQQKYAKE